MAARPNIQEVAVKAGVSTATVSRVANNKANVRASTRHRVERIMRELGYEPPRRRPGSIAAGTIALVLRDISTPFYCEVLKGVERVASERHCELILHTAREGNYGETTLRVLAHTRADGMLLVTPREAEVDWAAVRPRVPLVLVDHHGQDLDFPSVAIENLKGAYRGVRYLLGRQHQRVAIITGNLKLQSARDRLRGYRLAMEEIGEGFDDSLVMEGDFTQESGYEAARQMLRRGAVPDALFCCSDLMAVGALQALQEGGVAVPDELAVMGFDDLPVAAAVSPPLTTVAQPIEKMGATAARMLLHMIQGEVPDADRVILETRLVIRASA